MKIMTVDDSAFMRGLIKKIIGDSHEVVEAGNGKEAVEKYFVEKPSITFMDVIMPEMTGIEALKEIRSKDSAAKVIMCTSVGSQQQIIDEAVNAGATDFITKPFKKEDILEIVNKFGQ